MSKRTLVLLAASLLLCIGALAGCGEDDDDDGGEAATTAAGSAPAGGTADRLDESQWQQYQTSAAAFAEANQEAVAKVNACEGRVNVAEFKACVGDSISNVVVATGDLRTTLDDFDVAGACEAAHATFSGYLRNYQATADGLDKALNTGNAPAFNSGVQNMKTVAAAGTPAKQAFESACGPP